MVETTRSKVSDALVVPWTLSVATTCTDNVPTLPDCGVPEMVRVAGLKVSHDGSTVPPTGNAEYSRS